MCAGLLILFIGLPLMVGCLSVIDQILLGNWDNVRRAWLIPHMKSIFGQDLMPVGGAAARTGYLVALFGWITAAGSLAVGLPSPEGHAFGLGILLTIVCLLLGNASEIAPCVTTCSAAKTAAALRKLLQSAGLWLTVAVVLLAAGASAGSLSWTGIVDVQARAGGWGALVYPLGCFCLVAVAVVGESSRAAADATSLLGYCRRIALALVIVCSSGGGWHFWPLTPDTTTAHLTVLQAIPLLIVIVLKTLLVLGGTEFLRQKIGPACRPRLMWLIWNVMLPLAGLNAVVTVAGEWLLQPDDVLSRSLLSWIVICGGSAYGLLFHRDTISTQWRILQS